MEEVDLEIKYQQVWQEYWKKKLYAKDIRTNFIDTFDEPHRSRIKRTEEARRKGREANAKVLRLAALDASRRNVCFTTGMVLNRWTKCLDTILLKKPGNYNLEKL